MRVVSRLLIGSAENPTAKSADLYMVFPYMDYDLAGLLENPMTKLQPSMIKFFMLQLLEGTLYMHRVRRLQQVPNMHLLTRPY